MPGDFSPDGSTFRAELDLAVTIVDDAEADSDETFELVLEMSPGQVRDQLLFVDGDGNACPSPCRVTVTITDDDDEDATLGALSLREAYGDMEAITLDPAFSPGRLDYTAQVENDVIGIAVEATATSTSATVEFLDAGNRVIVDQDPDEDGDQFVLDVGTNVFKIRVSAGTAGMQTYTVTVTRKDDTLPRPLSARVYGRTLTIEFSEALADVVQADGFRLTRTRTLEGEDPDIRTRYGLGTTDIDGSTLTFVRLGEQVLSTDTDVKVGYTPPGDAENRLRDRSGNEVAAFTDLAVTNDTPVNVPATGAPAIAGTAQWPGRLTVDLSGIGDANGRTNADNGEGQYAYGYDWQRVDLDGSQQRARGLAPYLLVPDDIGKRLVVRVNFEDDAGYDEAATSTLSTVVAPALDRNFCPGGETELWCATLTSGQGPNGAGFDGPSGVGGLDRPTFEFAGNTYEVTRLSASGSGVTFATEPALPADGAGLVLHLQTFGGGHGAALTASGFSGNRWALAHPAAYGAGPLSGVPLLRGAGGASAFIPEPTDEGTQIAVRLSRPANERRRGRGHGDRYRRGGPDAGGGHLRHRRRQRPHEGGRRGVGLRVPLPLAALRRRRRLRRDAAPGRGGRHLHAGGGRRGQDDPGGGHVLRRQRLQGDAEKRGQQCRGARGQAGVRGGTERHAQPGGKPGRRRGGGAARGGRAREGDGPGGGYAPVQPGGRRRLEVRHRHVHRPDPHEGGRALRPRGRREVLGAGDGRTTAP